MKQAGPAHERETIIRFSDVDSKVTIWTASGKMYRKLMLLGFTKLADGERHAEFNCTLKNVRITRGRKMSDEQKAKVSARLKDARKIHYAARALVVEVPK